MRTTVLVGLALARIATAEPATAEPATAQPVPDAEPDWLLSQERRCAGDDWRACENLRSSIASEPAKTRGRYTGACRRGDAAACAFLGDWIFEHGIGSEGRIDPASSVAWYRKSCRAKASYGCARLAWSLRDSREATALHERLCDAGWAPSCVTFGARLDTWTAKPAQKRRAIAAFTRGCEAGDVGGCWRAGLALAYLPDATTPEREASWGRMDAACTAGDAASCQVLRDIFTCGRGTPCDAKRARPYAERARELDPTDGFYSTDPTRAPARCTCQTP